MGNKGIKISGIIAPVAFTLACLIAILYGFGAFDFTFADRDKYI